jgi:uncharacterized membrane protein YbhN (UPF0104 family)
MVGVLVKLAIAAIVLAAIHRTLSSAWTELSSQRLEFSFGWLVLAGAFCLLAYLPMSWFYYWLLRSFDNPVPLWAALRAHYIGQLGKYVPGKAMVFVLRIGLLPAGQRTISGAALAVYYETLTFVTVFAVLSASILIGWYGVEGLPAMAALVCAVGGILVTWPPLLRRLGALVARFKPDWPLSGDLDRVNYRHVIVGWVANVAACCLLGLSFWATLRSMLPGQQVPLSDLPFQIAALGLSVAAGFASMIPAGALVREAVLLELLDPRYGAGVALVAAIALRLVWLLSEVLISVILYAVRLKRL